MATDFLKDVWKDEDLSKGGGDSSSPFVETVSLYETTHPDTSKARKEPRKGGSISTPTAVHTIRKATLEVPLTLSDKGLAMSKRTSMSAFSKFSLGGRWSASITGSSVIRGKTGYSTGIFDANYSLGPKGSCLRGGVAVGETIRVQAGGTARYKQSHLTVSGSAAPTDPRQWKASVNASHGFNWLTVKTSCFFLRSAQPLSYMLSLATKTAHRVELGLGWSLRKPVVSVAVHPKLSSRRRLSVSAQVRGKGSWQLGFVLTQTLQSAAQIGVGVWHASTKGITWILSFTHGDLIVRIPVHLYSDPVVWNPVVYAYMTFASKVLQDVVQAAFQLDDKADFEKRQLQLQKAVQDRQKSREDADQQQRLMKRQAASRVKQEEALTGLVILRAVYWIQDGETLDVTIPLQFWVSESSLTLPESSKAVLLGFCDINKAESTEKDKAADDSSWWSGFWTLPNTKDASREKAPKLTVKYDFGGQSYEITLLDDDGLSLPSSRAALLVSS